MQLFSSSVALKYTTCRIARSQFLESRFMRWRANLFALNALVSMMMKRKKKKKHKQCFDFLCKKSYCSFFMLSGCIKMYKPDFPHIFSTGDLGNPRRKNVLI